MNHLRRLVGKIKRGKSNTEVIVLFRVGKKYYQNTQENRESFEAYLHTGDEHYLMGLTDPMEA